MQCLSLNLSRAPARERSQFAFASAQRARLYAEFRLLGGCVLLVTCLLFKPSRAKGGDRKELARSSRGGSPVDYDRDRNYRDDRERFERGYRDYERRDYYRDDRGSRYDDRGGYPDDRR